MNTDQPLRKKRATPRVSVPFASLEVGDTFWRSSKTRALKSSFCTGRHLDGKNRFFVNPFCSVLITRLLTMKEACETVKAWTSLLEGKPFPAGAGEVIRPIPDVTDGRTHYVGDDCPGGHADVAQPNSDNNVTGPTS